MVGKALLSKPIEKQILRPRQMRGGLRSEIRRGGSKTRRGEMTYKRSSSIPTGSQSEDPLTLDTKRTLEHTLVVG